MIASCPGFATYVEYEDGGVELQTPQRGFPTWGNTQRRTQLEAAWGRWGRALTEAAARHDVPVSWLVGIMLAESGGNPKACSPCAACNSALCERADGLTCCAFGLMQFIGPTARTYGTSPDRLLRDPTHAIDIGARLVSDLRKRWKDLPRIAAAYNAGMPRCQGMGTFGWLSQGNYPMKVVRYTNTFLALGLGTPPTLASIQGKLVAGAAVGGALFWIWSRWR